MASNASDPIMSTVRVALVSASLLASLCLAGSAVAAEKPIKFAPGKSSAQVKGTFKGDDAITYSIEARAGQTMTVTLRTTKGSPYFNVKAPGASEALFIGSTAGDRFEGQLPVDGVYLIDVYLMRSAARRNETASFTLDVAIHGAAAGAPAGGAALDKTLALQGIRFHVTATPAGGSTALRIEPAGLATDNAPMERTVDGRVTGAEVGDLDADGSPEVYVFVASSDAAARGSLVAFAANHRKSLSEIALPALADAPAHAAGYEGHDEFTVLEGALGRRFPIHRDGAPSGKMRQLQYKLVPGEATWQLRVDRVVEF